MLVTSLSIMQERITRFRLAGEPLHVLIAPEVASISLMDFDRAEDAIAAGRTATEKVVDSIREMLKR